jgi:hypothetical protein
MIKATLGQGEGKWLSVNRLYGDLDGMGIGCEYRGTVGYLIS